MGYIENPKTKGSGIVCAIPQTSRCPNKCAECFFQSGRSYLEPLQDNLPNMPDPYPDQVVRVNDGQDSNVNRRKVISATAKYPMRFFNTAIPKFDFPGPVVYTVNPKDAVAELTEAPDNLMFVRVRVSPTNLSLCKKVIKHYATTRNVPVVLTFMRYYSDDAISEVFRKQYEFKKKILNSYWIIKPPAQASLEAELSGELVFTCDGLCKDCGQCLRLYHKTIERVRYAEE